MANCGEYLGLIYKDEIWDKDVESVLNRAAGGQILFDVVTNPQLHVCKVEDV